MSESSNDATQRQWLDLSLAQQSIWLDAKLSSASVYQLGGWARVAAPLDDAAVRQSVRLIMARHDALRLKIDDELPRQWLDESLEPPISNHELDEKIDPERAFDEYVRQAFASPLPLGDHPLFRIDLLKAGPNLTFILWRFHHLIVDSAAVSIALGHWFLAYDSLTAATPGQLGPPSSFVQTIRSDAAYLESVPYHQDLTYWTSRFDPLPLPLIADMERRASGEHAQPPSSASIITGPAYRRLQSAAKAAGMTVNRLLFALFSVTLARRYGQNDVVAGVALHRRDLSNRYTIGLMAGVIPVRCTFETYWSLEDCVQAFSEQVDADLRHQRLPVDVLSRSLGLSGTGRAGLFEAAMSYIPADRSQHKISLDGLPITTGVVDTREASPISLHVTELDPDANIEIRVNVNPEFLDPCESATLATLFQAAIERFLEDPGIRFEELDSITAAERALVVEKWNRTERKFEGGTLDGLFRVQAARTPDAVAVIGRDGGELKYADLDSRSTRLAEQLVAAGVGPERVVGVGMERSTETIVAILGILKAGGVYLPLDPAYPADRLEYMARDAGATLVLEEGIGNWAKNDNWGIRTDHATANGGPASSNPQSLIPNPSPDRLAYIIYTSGTTGQPKGVVVSHVAPVNLAFARRACHDPLGVGDRVLAAISVGFDVSIGQLLLPLLSGATVVIAGDVKTMGAAEFWSLLADRRVTHINSVPSFFDSILDSAPPAGALSLKRVMLGGEALSGALVARIQQAVPGIEVVNMYGPTEACIDATYHVATPADLSSSVLPIGRPLSNYRAYVLNSQVQPVGIGVTGELYLGGAGLARGYVNAAELTNERFVADPFSQNPGARLYKTGDRARWRSDGRIEFLGRVDQQVKIRGFRVEPAEIEAALLKHPQVAQAVVVPHVGRAGGPARLVAYIVPHARESLPDSNELRSHLAESLPDYMVPSAFVFIAEIPLNANGKLDAKALPSPDFAEGEYVEPRTSTERVIADLFAEVLGLERCGATDHFFELGGHSLLATSLVSKMIAGGMRVQLREVFETPTVEMLARRVDASLPSVAGAGVIGPRQRPADLPLSFPQERIWFVDRLQQDSSYNIPIAFELRGALDIAAAEKAIERIVQRHEALRTRIVLKDSRPVQTVNDAADFRLELYDLSTLGQSEQEHALEQKLLELVQYRFDLAADLPFKLLLIALAPDRHVLAAVIHHVAFDGWSAGLFLREFAALYAAFRHKQSDPLPPLPIQYADFALWQREQNWDNDLSYWLEELRDAPVRLDLPMSSPPGGGSWRLASTLSFNVAPEVHAKLVKLARDNNCSLFMVLHAAFAMLLSRLSGQDDIVIGTVSANRNHAEMEPVIGCFVNTLPLRTRLSPGESFAKLLARVKSSDLAAYAHQDLAFEQLVEALHPNRSLQHTPVFQVMLVLQNTPMPLVPLDGLELRPIALEAETAKLDLTLSFVEQDGGLSGTIEYARNRFATEDISGMAGKFARILEAVAAKPGLDASRVEILDAAERELVVNKWNQTHQSFENGTLDGLFRAQAARTPDAVAVIGTDGNALSYAELDTRSTRLAEQLVAAGVRPERVVGVRMERSTETIIALLAILKAGGAYLPLDPTYPADRLDYMASDAGAMLVLESIDGLTGDAGLPTFDDPNRLAYIIYTSGTTGQPKGVAVSHVAPVNLAFARRACHDPLGIGDRVLAAISVGFDVSIGQLLLPLLSGAAVVIAGDVKTMGAAEFWRFIADRRVTHINSVPSFFDSILGSAPPAGTLALKRLMLGGEALSGLLVARIQKAMPGVEVVNMYGPTEACIDATFHVATAEDVTSTVLPIGRPLSNYRAYILDAQLQPVGVGVTGELYLGGSGLARGYVNAPELTSERFIADPFSKVPGDRLYKTGDRARWRGDGRIEFLGRVDEQVKIRGFRVEPAEIEAKLKQQSGVRDAAVIATTATGAARLIAYYCGDAIPESLRGALASALPDYMVPAAFVKLDSLPLSANGKLDRKALPAPDQAAFVARAYEPPLGPVETRIAELWAELLKIDRVGRNDDFFELGGHSLLAVTLIERMQRLGLQADVRTLFTTPTIAGLTAARDRLPRQDDAPPNLIVPGCEWITPEMLPLATLTQDQIDRIIASVPGGVANVQDIYPLSPLQEGILFQHRLTAMGDPYLTPFLLAFDDRDRLEKFIVALDKVVERHDVLRSAMFWKDLDEPVQVVLRRAAVPIDEVMVDSHTDAGKQLMARFDPRHYRLDVSAAPLLRAVVSHDAANDRWLLLMLTHHLVLDHTSLEIVVNELRTLMSDARAVLPPSLPYRNFIAMARACHSAEEHEAFFKSRLGDVEEPTAPFGMLDIQSGDGQTLEGRLTLDDEVSQRLRERARAMGVAPASLFHLAWAAVLGHVAGKSDVVFGTVLFGRMRSGTGADRVVGMFINTLPIRVKLDATPVSQKVAEVHQALSELLAHEHAPLALAQRSSSVPAPAPLFSSLFNYRHSPADSGQSASAGIEIVEAAERTNYPLAMAVDDSGKSFLLTALSQVGIDPERVCAQFQQAVIDLLTELDSAPATPVSKIQVLPAAERALVVNGWNRTEQVFESGTLDGLFRAQAARTPNAVAVIGTDGKEVNYAELDARSTSLAEQLVAAGVGPERVVGVRMQRSTETVIAMLAILKAGGVYLPLDPAYPADRLDYIARDAGAMLVLESVVGLSGHGELPVLNDPNRLAYIIYTSGTTGQPKGVAVSHVAPVNLAFARRACHDPLGVGDRVLAAISVGFDVSIGQLLLPLLSGATVVISGDVKTMGAAQFWSLLAERRVTHINSVPSFFDSILDSAPRSGTLALKRLMLGGEALSGALVARIQKAIPGVVVVNMYGPTETCIDATYHVAMPADLTSAVLPIGRPLSNYRAYILDDGLRPVGIGVTGELYLGGAGLARGYVNAPELTAERFISDTFSQSPEARLYKTGDRARWRADGRIEFIGRVDEQVKIRGFRVEPAEIESQLKRQAGVRDAAVIASSASGSTRLIAYYCGEAVPESIRTGLTSVLPDYMVPAAFVKMDHLPLSANGKLDRKALPKPNQAAFVARAYEAPVGLIEKQIADIWSELLKVESVGRNDNFFELGGHSLLAVTLIERLQRSGISADVRTLFATPTIVALASAIDAQAAQVDVPPNQIPIGAERITPEMLPLVQLTQEQIDRVVGSIPGGAANVQDIYPLSPLQEGMVFQHLMAPQDDPYLSPFMLAFDGRDRLDAFVHALHLIVERHDVLRTSMAWDGLPEPVQVVWRRAEFEVDEVMLDSGSVDAAASLRSRFEPRKFTLDLSKAPLLHVAVTHDRSQDRWLLLMLTHHLVLDHTSLEILVHELRTLIADPAAKLPEPLPYRNFIAQTRGGISRTEHEAFFQKMLGDVDEPTAPFGLLDTQDSAAASVGGRLTIEPQLDRRIRDRARRMGITPASLFHLAWASVLGHISGRSDVVFGTVLFGRMRSGAGADRVVGMFINTLPIRIKLDQTAGVDAARYTHQALADLMVHEHAPLSIAQRSSRVPQPGPLFSSLFNYRYSGSGQPEGEKSGVEVIDSAESTNYPLAMAIDDSGTSFLLNAVGQPKAAPQKVCHYLHTAIESLCDLLDNNPSGPIASLDVLPKNEVALVTTEWNRTEQTFEPGTLDGLFRAQAASTPNAIAVVGRDGGELTFAGLDHRSTRLAEQLVAAGVVPEQVVGVRMERSTETIIALLAILKAGGVYLPLDPAYPGERLDFMARDAGAVLVLEEGIRDWAKNDNRGIKPDNPAAKLPADSNPQSRIPNPSPDRLAYIIYTSGTTGQPKGVAVSHAAPVNLAFARRACHDPLGLGDRVLAAISVGFDVSIGQLLLPLLSGATVVIASDVKTMSAAEFWSFIAQRRVTHINSVPSFFDSIIDTAPSAGMLSLKRIMLGGEALNGALVARIQRAIPGVEVVNMYGPTEACIDATYHVATPDDLKSAVLPIGRPLSNYVAYVLDAQLRPVGVGVAGELYLGGAGLANGYVNAPELTAQRFLADPFSQNPGAKLYKTGDRARWRADGRLEFLGRVDEQVKIRGFRVEPAEIEARLKRQDGVRDAAVIALSASGTTRLIAYYCGDAVAETLRHSVAAVLPDYMVPSAVVKLERLPLSANGKLDRKALPAPDQGAFVARPYEAPVGAIETQIADIWLELLFDAAAESKVERVGRTDNFFELGGDSLSAMRLIAALDAKLNLKLPIRALFQNPTVSGLADAAQDRSPKRHQPLVALRSTGLGPNLFCIHPAGGHVFCYLPLLQELEANRPVYGLQASGLEEGETLAASIEEMAHSYVAAVRTVQPEGPYHLLGMSSGGLVAFEMAQQLKAAGDVVQSLVMLDTTVPDSESEVEFTEATLLRVVAEELGCGDLLAAEPAPTSLAAVLDRAHLAGRLPPDFTLALAERIANVFRNTVRLCVNYRPSSWDGPMLVVRAIKRFREADRPPEWSHLASGSLEVVDIDCGHADLVSASQAAMIAGLVAGVKDNAYELVP